MGVHALALLFPQLTLFALQLYVLAQWLISLGLALLVVLPWASISFHVDEVFLLLEFELHVLGKPRVTAAVGWPLGRRLGLLLPSWDLAATIELLRSGLAVGRVRCHHSLRRRDHDTDPVLLAVILQLQLINLAFPAR